MSVYAGLSYSVAVDNNAAGPANTVLVGVEAGTGAIVSTTGLPFNHVAMLAEGMFLEYDDAANEALGQYLV